MLKLFSKKEKIVYFPGCIAKYAHQEHAANWKAILDDLGIDYSVIDALQCCGSPALTSGHTAEFQMVIEDNKKKLKGTTLLVSSCPHCINVFSKYYDLPAKHTSELLYENIERILPKKQDLKVSYHDPCTLARKLGVADAPREVLKKAGYIINEFKKNKSRTSCCGASGGMIYNDSSLAKKIAKARCASSPEKTIIVSCPLCYYHMSRSCEKEKILELSEALLEK